MKGPLTVDRGEWCSACCWPLGVDKASGGRVPIRRDGRWVHRCSVCGGRTDEPETEDAEIDAALRGMKTETKGDR